MLTHTHTHIHTHMHTHMQSVIHIQSVIHMHTHTLTGKEEHTQTHIHRHTDVYMEQVGNPSSGGGAFPILFSSLSGEVTMETGFGRKQQEKEIMGLSTSPELLFCPCLYMGMLKGIF